MSDKKQIAIKERILKQAMEFWGVSDIRDMDPVIDLLLEVFAHDVQQAASRNRTVRFTDTSPPVQNTHRKQMVAAKAGPCAYDYYPQSWGMLRT